MQAQPPKLEMSLSLIPMQKSATTKSTEAKRISCGQTPKLSYYFQSRRSTKHDEGVYWDSCKNKYSELNEMFVEKLMLIDITKAKDDYPHEVIEFVKNPARLSSN